MFIEGLKNTPYGLDFLVFSIWGQDLILSSLFFFFKNSVIVVFNYICVRINGHWPSSF